MYSMGDFNQNLMESDLRNPYGKNTNADFDPYHDVRPSHQMGAHPSKRYGQMGAHPSNHYGQMGAHPSNRYGQMGDWWSDFRDQTIQKAETGIVTTAVQAGTGLVAYGVEELFDLAPGPGGTLTSKSTGQQATAAQQQAYYQRLAQMSAFERFLFDYGLKPIHVYATVGGVFGVIILAMLLNRGRSSERVVIREVERSSPSQSA